MDDSQIRLAAHVRDAFDALARELTGDEKAMAEITMKSGRKDAAPTFDVGIGMPDDDGGEPSVMTISVGGEVAGDVASRLLSTIDHADKYRSGEHLDDKVTALPDQYRAAGA